MDDSLFYDQVFSNCFDLKFRNIPSNLVNNVELEDNTVTIRYYETTQFDVFGFFTNIISEGKQLEKNPFGEDVLEMSYCDSTGKVVRTDKWSGLRLKSLKSTVRKYEPFGTPISTEVIFEFDKAE